MNSKQIITIIACLLAFVATAGAQDLDTKYATSLIKPGEQAPEFALNDMEGKSHKLSDLKGSYVVLDFWASWCPDCRKDIPEMKRLHEKYGKKVRFVGISGDDKRANWEKCVKDNQMNWLHLSELKKWKETNIRALYQVQWIPSLYLLDGEGRVVLATVMVDKLAAKLEEVAGR